MMKLAVLFLFPSLGGSFTLHTPLQRHTWLKSTVDAETVQPTLNDLDDLKAELVATCTRSPKPSLPEVQDVVEQLESTSELVSGIELLSSIFCCVSQL